LGEVVADPAELILLAASVLVAVALVVLTRSLVHATRDLAGATKQLAKATDQLRAIEERRDQADARRRRIRNLKRKIELTRLVLRRIYDQWRADYLDKGNFPHPEGEEILELATLLDYTNDHAERAIVEELVSGLNLLARGVKIQWVPADRFMDGLRRLKNLAEDIPRWEKELLQLSEEGTSY
jgi:hypothetical protein